MAGPAEPGLFTEPAWSIYTAQAENHAFYI